MKRTGNTKFPNSIQLFKFCSKVLSHQRGEKVKDQEIGAILEYNPSDCSHWKRGEKNVRSVFALAKLSEVMGVEVSLIYDIVNGLVNCDEAFFEYLESIQIKDILNKANDHASLQEMDRIRTRMAHFCSNLLQQSNLQTPPIYLPEILRNFSFISAQNIEMIDKLSRILKVKPGQYAIHMRKGDLRPQTRWSVLKDLGRIIFEAERSRFPELETVQPEFVGYELLLFASNLLIPKSLLTPELSKLDNKKNLVHELSTLFWAPKSLVSLQLKEVMRDAMPLSKIHASAAKFGGQNFSVNAQQSLENKNISAE